MKNFFSFFLFIAILIIFHGCFQDKNKETISYSGTRDEIAYQKTFPKLKKELAEKQIDIHQFDLFIRAIKLERRLEVFAKNKTDVAFTFIKNYDFCNVSGDLGPKRKQGDYQIPEGLYYIEIFNPVSSYHLSLGINYPNASDKILSDKNSPGGDIYLHGNCVTIGCIPITDEKIEELYTLASLARKQGQENIPVHIFPFNMDNASLEKWSKEYPIHKLFWKNLQESYISFQKTKKKPFFNVNKSGKYIAQ